MAKVKINLSQAPEAFSHPVKLELPNGDEAEIVIEYIYREKLEYGKWIDEQLTKQKDKKTAEKDKKKEFDSSIHDLMAEQMQLDAEGLLEVAKGWDLQEPFTQENIVKFENKYPGVIQAIATAYPAALYATRLKP